jgi:hypothetical protein
LAMMSISRSLERFSNLRWRDLAIARPSSKV